MGEVSVTLYGRAFRGAYTVLGDTLRLTTEQGWRGEARVGGGAENYDAFARMLLVRLLKDHPAEIVAPSSGVGMAALIAGT